MRRYAILLVLLALPARPARAEWHATPFAGITFGTNATFIDFVDVSQAAGRKKFVFGGAGTWLGTEFIGLEGEFTMVPGFFQGGKANDLVLRSRVTTIGGSVILTTPPRLTGYGLRPYAAGGAGWLRATARDTADALSFERNSLALIVGGGAMGPLSDRRAVRFDVRYIRTIRNDAGDEKRSVSFWRGTVGLMFKL